MLRKSKLVLDSSWRRLVVVDSIPHGIRNDTRYENQDYEILDCRMNQSDTMLYLVARCENRTHIHLWEFVHGTWVNKTLSSTLDEVPVSRDFNRDQLVTIVEVFLGAAVDRIQAFLPPTIPMAEFESERSKIMDMIHSVIETVDMALPDLWARLNNDGMAGGEWSGGEEFRSAIKSYIVDVTTDDVWSMTDMRPIAEKFVDTDFASYLGGR